MPFASNELINTLKPDWRMLKCRVQKTAWDLSRGKRHIEKGAITLAAEEVGRDIVFHGRYVTGQELLSVLTYWSKHHGDPTPSGWSNNGQKPQPSGQIVVTTLTPATMPAKNTLRSDNDAGDPGPESVFSVRYRNWCHNHEHITDDAEISSICGVDVSLPSYVRSTLKEQGYSFERDANGWIIYNPLRKRIRELQDAIQAAQVELAKLMAK